MKNYALAFGIALMLTPCVWSQQCGGNRSVDFGNANLGQQLASQNVQTFQPVMEAPIQRVAMKQGAASAASSASTLTQPNGYLTFQEGSAPARLTEVPQMNNTSEVTELRQMVASLMQELNDMKQQKPVFQTAAFQSVGGGASASSSSSTSAAPNIGALTLTAPTPVAQIRQNNSACSSGGCGGRAGFLQRFRRGNVNVSRSSSFSRSVN